MPRTIAAALGGGYLAIAGLLLQVYFRNPIVGPFILGISSGATLTVSFVMLTSLTLGMTVLNPFMATLAAFVGGLRHHGHCHGRGQPGQKRHYPAHCGPDDGYLCHAVTSVLVAFAEKEKIKGFVSGSSAPFPVQVERDRGHGLSGRGHLPFGLLPGQTLNAFLLGRNTLPPWG